MFTRRTFFAGATLWLTSAGRVHAQGAGFPTRPITLVLPFPAGGGGDAVVRPLARKLQEALGQPVIVDNRAGASATIGCAYVAKAPPDGYTLLVNVIPTHVNVAAVIPNLPYDPIKSFAPVGQFVAGVPQILLARPSLGVNTFAELVALVKSKPGKINYGSQGAGTILHLIGEMLHQQVGLDWLHVPYKGGAPALQALVSDQIDVLFSDASAIPFILSGKAKALAVTTEKRVARLPDVPTIAELGYPNVTTEIGFALFAPAGTPRPIVDRLSTAMRTVAGDAEMKGTVERMSAISIAGSPEELRTKLDSYASRYLPLIKSLNLTTE